MKFATIAIFGTLLFAMLATQADARAYEIPIPREFARRSLL